MSVSGVTGRISEIQSQLALLGSGTGSRATSAGSAFGTQLASALGAGTTASTASTALDELTTQVATGAATGTTSGTTGDAVVAEARTYLGIPYLWGGTDPAKGLDCSGLVQLVYRNLGIDLPRVSRDQAQQGTEVASLDEAQPGDLLAFGEPVDHIAIYIGDGQMIEAPRTGLDVRVIDVYKDPVTIRRILGSSDDPTAATSGAAPAVPAALGGATSGVPYADLFNKAAATYGVDANLLAAVARQESGFDPGAVSPAGAQGLMQLMPATAAGLGVENSFDPAQAVDGAARLLDDLLGRFGTTPLALAAYNAGPGAVLRYDGIPPYPETQNYVRSVMAMLGAS